jgi:hypothetical protein
MVSPVVGASVRREQQAALNAFSERVLAEAHRVSAHPELLFSLLYNQKGAFIQIMPLTWHSLLLPVIDRHPGLTI